MTNTELQLRELLWMHHNCLGRKIGHLYGDDGEMQCHNCGGDFLRQSLKTLAENIDNPNPANFFKGKDKERIAKLAFDSVYEDKIKIPVEAVEAFFDRNKEAIDGAFKILREGK